jgi:hypothetical protein
MTAKLLDLSVDFVGLEVPDRYVFGCGMDYKRILAQSAGHLRGCGLIPRRPSPPGCRQVQRLDPD